MELIEEFSFKYFDWERDYTEKYLYKSNAFFIIRLYMCICSLYLLV